MPSYGCQACGLPFYTAARLEDTPGGDRCEACGGQLVELAHRRTLEDRQVGNVLYPGGDVQASPIDPPIA